MNPSIAARSAAVGLLLGLLPAACTKSEQGLCGPPSVIFGLDQHWSDRTDYPGVGEGRLIITDNGEDKASILDLQTVSDPDQVELARVPVGTNPVELEGPHHGAMDPNGEYYYIGISNYVPGSGSGPHGSHGTGTADGYVLKYRASDNVLVGSARVDPNPGDLTIGRDGKTLYVTHYDLIRIMTSQGDEEKARSRLAVIDAATMTRKAMIPLCPAAHGIRLSADDKLAYVACYSDELAIVRLDDPSFQVFRVKVAPDAGGLFDSVHQPYAVIVTPSGNEVWISGTKSRKLLVYDVASGRIDPSRTVALRGQPIFGAFTADGTTLYMATQSSDRIAVVDTRSLMVDEIVLPPPICKSPHQIALTPDERFGLVVCEGDHVGPGAFVALDLTSRPGRYHHHVTLGVFPDYVGILRRPKP